MKNIGFSAKDFLVVLCFTLLWFTTFSGRSEIICLGDPMGFGYGNFVIWNMDNPVTSLSKLVDITKFCLDFSVSYLVTLVLFLIILRIAKIKNHIFKKKKWLTLLFICTTIISIVFSIEFMFDVFFDNIECKSVSGTYHFELDV